MGQRGASDLVERARSGDGVAFDALYRSHVAGVEAVVRAHLHGAPAVDDVVQETFVRALEGMDRLADADQFRPWLYAIARHVAIDHHRAQAKTRQAEEDEEARVPDPALGPEVLAELCELSKLVRGCVVGLSRRDAVAIDLVTYFGFSPAEVGAALGITAGAAKVAVHRARRRLRDALVLELMVRRRGAGCADLAALLEAEDLLAGARHVRSCERCVEVASDEVRLYDSSPTTLTPALLSAADRASGSAGRLHASSSKPATSAVE